MKPTKYNRNNPTRSLFSLFCLWKIYAKINGNICEFLLLLYLPAITLVDGGEDEREYRMGSIEREGSRDRDMTSRERERDEDYERDYWDNEFTKGRRTPRERQRDLEWERERAREWERERERDWDREFDWDQGKQHNITEFLTFSTFL